MRLAGGCAEGAGGCAEGAGGCAEGAGGCALCAGGNQSCAMRDMVAGVMRCILEAAEGEPHLLEVLE